MFDKFNVTIPPKMILKKYRANDIIQSNFIQKSWITLYIVTMVGSIPMSAFRKDNYYYIIS